MSSFWFTYVHSITFSAIACATYPGSFVLMTSCSEVQCCLSKCQMWAVPSLLPETKRSPWLAHWMLSTRSECASFSRMRCGPSSPTIRYTLQDKRCMCEITKHISIPTISLKTTVSSTTQVFTNRTNCTVLQQTYLLWLKIKPLSGYFCTEHKQKNITNI